MRRRIAHACGAAALFGLLAACAGQTPLIDRASDGRVRGDSEHVSVEGNRLNSLPLAVAHCARYGRSAQWIRTDGDRSVYACVRSP